MSCQQVLLRLLLSLLLLSGPAFAGVSHRFRICLSYYGIPVLVEAIDRGELVHVDTRVRWSHPEVLSRLGDRARLEGSLSREEATWFVGELRAAEGRPQPIQQHEDRNLSAHIVIPSLRGRRSEQSFRLGPDPKAKEVWSFIFERLGVAPLGRRLILRRAMIMRQLGRSVLAPTSSECACDAVRPGGDSWPGSSR